MSGEQRQTLLIAALVLLGVIAALTALAVGVNVNSANRYEAVTECVAQGHPPLECRESLR